VELFNAFVFFLEKRNGQHRFGKRKEHVGRLLVPVHRSNQRIQRCDNDPQLEWGDIWIDSR
jgi:hypothetical protein